jgi:hypothetical protein
MVREVNALGRPVADNPQDTLHCSPACRERGGTRQGFE